MLSKQLGNKVNNNGITCSKHVPATNTAAVVTLTAVANQRRIISSIQWSYSDVPTGGNLLVADETNTYLDLDITAAGPGGLTLCIPALVNSALTVTLHAGTVQGKLAVQSTCESD